MNVLDENIPEHQRLLLRSWRFRVHQIGPDIGRRGMLDDEIIPLLHTLPRPTFFTRDVDFYHRRWCHAAYCLVWLDVTPYEVASFAYRFLRHPAFRSKGQRMGKVARVSHLGVRIWRAHGQQEELLDWMPGARRGAQAGRPHDTQHRWF